MKSRTSKNNENYNGGFNPRLKNLIIEIVENQIRDNNPPVTKVTFERLIDKGYSKQQAKEKIAAVALMHVYDALTGKIFDEVKYTKELSEIE